MKKIFRTYLKDINEDLVDDVASLCVFQAISDFFAGNKSTKGILKKLPQAVLQEIKTQLDFIVVNIPKYLLLQQKPELLTPNAANIPKPKTPHLIFYIPMTEIDPVVDEDNGENITMAPAPSNSTYQIYKKYSAVKNQIAFSYDQFKDIIITGLSSPRSDEELLGEFLDVFGCEVFDFLNEIIQRRNDSIDWSVPNGDTKDRLQRRPGFVDF